MATFWENLGGTQAFGTPAVVSRASGNLDVLVVRQEPAPTRVWRNSGNGSTGQWDDLGPLPPSAAGVHVAYSPAAVAPRHDQLDVFAVALTFEVYRNQWKDGSGWGGWQNLGAPGGGARGRPSACQTFVGGVALFARGADGAVHLKNYQGSGTGGPWQNLGLNAPQSDYRVTANTWGSSQIHLYAQGDDDQLVYKSFSYHLGGGDPATMSWNPLGGKVTGSLTAVGWAWNRVHVFGVGTDEQQAPSEAVLHKWWDGSQWSAWELLSGSGVTHLQAVTWGPDRIDLFGRGGVAGPDTGAVHHRSWDGTTWNPPKDAPWESLAGDFYPGNGPGVASWGPNRLDVFMIQNTRADKNVWHRWWDGSGWKPES